MLSTDGKPLHGWEMHILAYLVGGYMTSDIDKERPWDDPVNQKYFKCVLPEFINSEARTPDLVDESGYGLNHFSANSRLLAPGQSYKADEITDGAANTIMFGEVNTAFSPWGRPANVRDPAAGINAGPDSFGGPNQRRGAYFSMVDASARFISEDVDPEVLRALSTPADGDAAPTEE